MNSKEIVEEIVRARVEQSLRKKVGKLDQAPSNLISLFLLYVVYAHMFPQRGIKLNSSHIYTYD